MPCFDTPAMLALSAAAMLLLRPDMAVDDFAYFIAIELPPCEHTLTLDAVSPMLTRLAPC
jgi:hypothetical protein